MNPKALEESNVLYKMVNGVMGDECEATQFEGRPLDNVTPCKNIEDKKYPYCMSYKDEGWPQ